MRVICADIETTITILDAKKKKKDLSPFNSNNKLVSVGWKFIENGNILPGGYVFFHHKDLPNIDVVKSSKEFQTALSSADIFVGHNAKFDAMWLEQCGFVIPKDIRCTMVREYVLNRGEKDSLSLEDCCIANNVALKKKDLVQPYLDTGIMFDEIPWEIVEEYGKGDVQSCAELYLNQEKLYNLDVNKGLIKTRDMMCQFTDVLSEMEQAGIKIDQARLKQVENEFTKEKTNLEIRIKELISETMGDTPVNINSPEQLSKVIYSRSPRDKAKWIKTFNIGLNVQNKPLKRPYMEPYEFRNNVSALCETAYKTTASQCNSCTGMGYFFKQKKNGENFKKSTKCPNCEGSGLSYIKTDEVAGFKLMPTGVDDCATGGFSTDKETLEKLLDKSRGKKNDKAVEFLTAIIRVSALDTYINSFVKGIERGTQANGVLHAKFNQTITSTGRLSSTDPNLQNQPRGNTFPIRGVFISRWAGSGGTLCETDFSQLEFRCAGHLAECSTVRNDVLAGLDVHSQTAKILTDAGQETNRQDAKPHTFKPLYGGLSGTDAEVTYYKAFLDKYTGVKNWHVKLQEEAIKYKKITLPTGREYSFPWVIRNRWGGATHKTQIVNYPVQGFATADIVPLSMIYLKREYKRLGLKSLICLTVHDSIVTDVFPGELEIVVKLHKNLHGIAEQALKDYYGITMYVPLDSETKVGPNLIEMKKV